MYIIRQLNQRNLKNWHSSFQASEGKRKISEERKARATGEASSSLWHMSFTIMK